MNNKRAREIASSPIMANVTYNGNPVYIEGVNDNKGTAYVHYLNRSGNVLEVSLNELVEH